MTPNFILLPHPDPIAIFWAHFPHLKGKLDCEDECDYYALYFSFADYLLEQPFENAAWQDACALIHELAEKNHPTTDRPLDCVIFDFFSQYPAAIAFLRASLQGKALQLLEEEIGDGLAEELDIEA